MRFKLGVSTDADRRMDDEDVDPCLFCVVKFTLHATVV